VAVGAALLLGVAVHADNWPEFRGPTGQGLAGDTALLTEWGPNKNVAWKQDIPGKGWSSPVVVDGRIYLTTAVAQGTGKKSDQSLRALCLDAKDGKILWDEEVFKEDGNKSPSIHGKNSHASPTPLVDGKRLYVHFGHMGTACLDLDGKVLWRNDSIKYEPVHGNGGTPILVDKALIFSCDGGDEQFIVALNREDGKELWKTERKTKPFKGFSFSTPLLITVNGQKQVISPASEMIAGYDPATGEEIWRIRHKGYSVIPRPVYGHGLVFFSTGYDQPTLLAIRPDGHGDVTKTHIAWKMTKGAPHTPSPLLVGDEFYTVSDGGIASCLDAATGKVHWQERVGGNYSASPLFAGGKVYFQSEDGTGVVVKAGKKFDLVQKNPLNERSLASYAVADGALFIRTEKRLYRFQER
jgi:outer membrane protein assembly factor BamB